MTKTGTKTRIILAVLLAAALAVTVTPFTAFANDTEEENAVVEENVVTVDAAENEESTKPIEPTGAIESTDPTGSTEPAEPTEPTEPEEPQPAVPTATVIVKGPALFISWTAMEDADYYEVYRSYKKDSTGSLLKKVTGAVTFTDKAVASGKRAYYQVRAHKTDGTFTDFSAAASNVIYRVYIEAGHGIDRNGRWDSGCTWKKYQEAKLMIPICKATAKYLRARGIYVYTDADNGNNKNLKWLVNNLKSYNVSVLVNVHCDYKKAPRGTLPLYRYNEQKKLAQCLNAGVHKTVKIKNRGLKKRTNLASLNKTSSYCVACLFETGNIKKDNKILRKKYDAYGKGLAMGVCSYLGVKW